MRHATRSLFECLMSRSRRVLSGRELCRSAIVFAPHFDDEVLGCGGTILHKISSGATVRIVFMTDGSRSHAHLMPEGRLRQMRSQEGLAAAQTLGVPPGNVVLLGFPETRLAEHKVAAGRAVAALLREHHPVEVFVTYRRDGPQDHVATYQAVRRALGEYERTVWLYEYPVWLWDRWPWVPYSPRRVRHIPRFYRDALLGSMYAWRECRYAVYVGNVLERKRNALLQHASQTVRWNGDPRWPILSEVGSGEFLPRFFEDYEIFARHRITAGLSNRCRYSGCASD